MNRIWTIWILVLYYFCFIASMEQSTGVATEHSSDMSTKAVTNTPKLIKQQRILRGFECDPKDYPYYVLIMEKIKTTLYKSCGGSLISPLMVLTACHCVDLRYPQYAGVMMDTEFQQIRAVSHYHMHPDFKNTTMDNDIAVFVLKEPMDRPKDKDVYSKLPRIDLAGDIRDFCENALVMGYGKTESSIDSHNLQCVILPVISSADCETYYGNMVFKSDFCTLSTEGKDACQGDSGGPILCQEVQVGIVSWGYKCGKINKPGVYVRVDKYLEFLEGIHIKEEKTPRASGASIQHLTISGHFITVFILFGLIKVIV